jgi:hypothetical protein
MWSHSNKNPIHRYDLFENILQMERPKLLNKITPKTKLPRKDKTLLGVVYKVSSSYP